MSNSMRQLSRTIVIAMALLAALLGSPAAAGSPAWSVDETGNPGAANQSHALVGVTAISPTDAWAVMQAGSTPTTLHHWDGAVWTEFPGPNPGSSRLLNGIDSTGAHDVWAVGHSRNDKGIGRTLTLHWNGSTWRRIDSPNRGTAKVDNDLFAVSAISKTDAWAVGRTWDGTVYKTLTMHWNGEDWSIVASPNPGDSYPGNELDGVSARAADDVWAVGTFDPQMYNGRNLILHWNGRKWKQVAAPNPGAGGRWLTEVTAIGRRDAWAVGEFWGSPTTDILPYALHWDGDAWTKVKMPAPSAGGDDKSVWLDGMDASSSTNVLAAGHYWNGTSNRTLILRWNGSEWKKMPTPNGDATHTSELKDVAAVSGSFALAVGYRNDGYRDNTFAMHCC